MTRLLITSKHLLLPCPSLFTLSIYNLIIQFLNTPLHPIFTLPKFKISHNHNQVRDEVDLFRPKVPLIVALRNPGMKERHWTDLAEKTGCYIPTDRWVDGLFSVLVWGV